MKFVKNFDYFQKLSYDVSKPTMVGAVISVISISMISLLLLVNLIDFLTPNIKKDPILHQDYDNSKIHMHINVKVNSPCVLISIDQEDQNGNRNNNIESFIWKSRIDKHNKVISKEHQHPIGTLDEIVEQIRDEEACLIEGFIEVDKVQGIVQISYHYARMFYNVIAFKYPDEFSKLSLSHKLYFLKFGEMSNTARILKKYGYNQYTSFNRDDIPDYKYSNKPNFDYFIKVIPFLFKEENGDPSYDIMAYQYSLNSQDRKINNNDEDISMPVIIFNYDFSFLTMHFLTHICAIVGGVYFIFTILSRVLISCFDGGIEEKK